MLKHATKKPYQLGFHTFVCVCLGGVVCACVCDKTFLVLLTEIKFQKDQKYIRQPCKDNQSLHTKCVCVCVTVCKREG